MGINYYTVPKYLALQLQDILKLEWARDLFQSTFKHTNLVAEVKTLVISNDLYVGCCIFECIFLIFSFRNT